MASRLSSAILPTLQPPTAPAGVLDRTIARPGRGTVPYVGAQDGAATYEGERVTDFTTPHDAETLEALRIVRDGLKDELQVLVKGNDASGEPVKVSVDLRYWAVFASGYHAANEALRIASAKAARIEAGENYVNETA